jgi:molybdopterin-containing oxidoreductase family iron-sulfur binding subunit
MDKHQTDSSHEVHDQAGVDPGRDSIKKDGFVPPRHWVGPEELEASYWNDTKVQERRGQEFHDKPIETISMIERMDSTGMRRRDFLTVMGASMAMATFSCARRPVHKIIPYVVKPENIVPGVPNFYASTDPETGYGLLVKTREGRPIKLEGNPDHPMNRGALSARIQAAVLDLYDTDRLQAPGTRARGGELKAAKWEDVDAAIVAKLKGASRVRVLSGEMYSESTSRLVREFLAAFASGAHVQYDALIADEVVEAQNLSYGTSVVPHYAFDQAQMIVSLGADFLGTWISPVEFNRDWVKGRKLEGASSSNAKLSKVVVYEPNVTITGGNADERYAIRPGDELKVALAIAYEIIINQKASRYSGDATVMAALSGYKPEIVAEEIGLTAESLKKVAHDLWAARGKGLVVGGGIQSKTKDAVALQVAVNLLNSALENEGTTVDGTASPREIKSSFAGLAKLVDEMKAGQVDALIVYRSNPAFVAPKTLGFTDALRNVKTVIVIDSHDTETAQQADFVLPVHHFLENWGDSSPRKGITSLQQPTIAPIHESRAFEDMLLTWAKSAGLRTSTLMAQSADWHAYLMGCWKETHFKSGGSFDAFWENALKVGALPASSGRPSARTFRSASLTLVPKYTAAPKGGLLLALYETVALRDGRQANNAWLQEMPDPVSSITWDNFLNVGTQAAAQLGVKENDVVSVKAGDVTVELPVHVQPGMHPNAVSVAVGYGRRSVGKVGNLTGVDVFPMVHIEGGRAVFSGMPVTVAKTGRFYQLASTQWHTVTENRPVINDITLAEYREKADAALETEPELRLEKVPTMWPRHEYKGYRWGMSIDLNSCTGCGACVIACQAENNIPVVGRDQVRVSRQMHWIRIDRYYAGPAENPEMVFQPMLCQHCENAPCETVCPVLATVHDDEGLNVQAYNRCVGTRYCQNNCPYKVRRFNFFDHWKSYEGTMNMAWNPDVTVRSRGIMEKCTFCVQRLHEGKGHAKDEHRKVRDGEIQVACQQTCPTNAIVFGDINDKEAVVSKLREHPRAFRVLENLATMPVISYQTKVRNVERASEKHEGKGHEAEHGHASSGKKVHAEAPVHS